MRSTNRIKRIHKMTNLIGRRMKTSSSRRNYRNRCLSKTRSTHSNWLKPSTPANGVKWSSWRALTTSAMTRMISGSQAPMRLQTRRTSKSLSAGKHSYSKASAMWSTMSILAPTTGLGRAYYASHSREIR